MPSDDEPSVVYAKDNKGRFVSGNIGGGRPKGARNKLQDDFLSDVLSAWESSGKIAIAAMVEEKPSDFVKMVASLMPKEATLNINDHSEMSDDELAGRIRSLAAQLAPFLSGGIGDVEAGDCCTERAEKPSRVH